MSNKAALNKKTSFMLKKPPSMKIPSPPSLPLPVAIEYPTSPELILGEEIFPHWSHPKHPLSLVDVPDRFTCAGCKEYGSGYRFSCKHCEFQLHGFCALAPPLLPAHPFHVQHQLSFYASPVKGGIIKSKCDVCAKPTKGFAFRCNACGFQMHPCCAMLSNEINVPVHPHTLRLLPAMNYISANNNGLSSDSGGSASFVCGECNRRRSGRVYRCTVCEYHLHAVCAKSIVNGLQANGYKGQDHEKPSMLGTAARLASQVVIEFIGGLVEGLGEGVGEIFVQSIAKGRHPLPPAAPVTKYSTP